MIFAHSGYLITPYRPLIGALTKNDAILDACAAHPDRFGISPLSGDPRVLVAALLTDPRNAVWEVWQNASFVGIILLDRIVPQIDARLTFVFLDDGLASKAGLLNEFVQRCFADFGLHRLSLEAPEHMTVLIGFARRKLGFDYEGTNDAAVACRLGSRREHAYHDGTRWHDVVTLRRLREVA